MHALDNALCKKDRRGSPVLAKIADLASRNIQLLGSEVLPSINTLID